MNELSCLSVHNLIKAVSSENLSKRSILNWVKISWSTGGRLKFYKQKVFLLLMLIQFTLLSHDMNEEYRNSFACFFPVNDSESHIWSTQNKKNAAILPMSKKCQVPKYHVQTVWVADMSFFTQRTYVCAFWTSSEIFVGNKLLQWESIWSEDFLKQMSFCATLQLPRGHKSRILYSLDFLPSKRSSATSPTYIGHKTISLWTNGKE